MPKAKMPGTQVDAGGVVAEDTHPENEAEGDAEGEVAEDTHPEAVAEGDAELVLLHFDGEAEGDAEGGDAEEEASCSGRPL